MVQIIGILEVILFYFAYFSKLLLQRRRGIQTNQLGTGNKSKRTILIERLLRVFSVVIVAVMLVSATKNTYLIQNLGFRSIGLILFAFGIITFIIAMITMRDNWRAGIPDEDKTEMVSTGIYRFSRNPAFLGFDLTYIGICLSFGNAILIIIAIVTIILMHLQILEEEVFLEKTFGKQYIDYKGKVGRYFIWV